MISYVNPVMRNVPIPQRAFPLDILPVVGFPFSLLVTRHSDPSDLTTCAQNQSVIRMKQTISEVTMKEEVKKKFLWGSIDPHPLHVFLFCFYLGALTVAVAIRIIGQGTPAIETGLTLSSVQWSITATVLYTYVYQAMLGQQVVLKHVWMCKNRRALHVSDRIPLNTLEQMPLFLVLLWPFTIYIDAEAGGKLGLVYTFYTALYAVCYAFYGMDTAMQLFSTFPRYFILFYMQVSLLWALYYTAVDSSLRDILSSSVPILSFQLFSGYCTMMVVDIILMYPVVKLNYYANYDEPPVAAVVDDPKKTKEQ
jgi:hypothetical protein